MSCSLGSNEQTHDYVTGIKGSCNQLKRSLKHLAKRDLCVAMNMVVNQENKGQVYETAKFLFDNFGVMDWDARGGCNK